MDRGKVESVNLADEIIEEILSRAPVKSLLKFRCESKLWLSLISSQRFVESHLQKSIKNTDYSHHRVIFESDQHVLSKCSLQPLLNEPSSIQISPFYDPTNNEPMKGILIGCCRGLLCIHEHRNISLWNPATRISIKLPNLDCSTEKHGFGWDGKSGAYKVFVYGTNRLRRSECKIYSSKTNSWKTVEDEGYPSVYEITGVFACGKIHWLVSDDLIESWDLESEEFERIELPLQPPEGCRHYKLAEIGGCLHLLCVHFNCVDDDDVYIAVWAMKETGWLKLFTCSLLLEPPSFSIRPLFVGGPNGDILVLFEDKYLVYYPKENVLQWGENKNRICFNDGFVYIESLVSPNFAAPS